MAQQTPVRRRPTAATSAARPARRTTTRAASTAVDESAQVASTARTQGAEVASTAVASGQEMARTAGQDVKELAATVKEQAGQVGTELKEQALQLVEETKGQLQSRADAQTEKLAQSLRSLGNKAGAVAKGWPNEESSVREYVWQAAERLDQVADEIELRGIDGLVDEVSALARRNPTAFMVGAAVAGFGIGRILRASAASSDDEVVVEDETDIEAVAYEELGAG
jgi:hypothetical protein